MVITIITGLQKVPSNSRRLSLKSNDSVLGPAVKEARGHVNFSYDDRQVLKYYSRKKKHKHYSPGEKSVSR